MKKVEQIRRWVSKQFEPEDYTYHISGVVRYALKLAKAYKVDLEVVELAALLHDIGRADIKTDPIHHLTGIPIAERVLRKYKYSEKIIEEIKHCIESHRTTEGPRPKTMVAKIVANADAMVHFDHIPVLFYWRARRGVKFIKILDWVDEKLENDWKIKITLPVARKMIKQKYLAAKLLLSAMRLK